jgi:ribosomal protein S18 acetylase RimI-like enzyme
MAHEPSQIRADIVSFSGDYTRTVLSWLDSPEILYAVCRSKDFPPEEGLIATWHRKDVTPYLLFSENAPVAYGELWNRPMEIAMEIAHLLVDPHKRSQGYGVKMLQLLYDRAAARPTVTKVLLNLYNDDEVALGCYLKSGFQLVGTTPAGGGLRLIRMVK